MARNLTLIVVLAAALCAGCKSAASPKDAADTAPSAALKLFDGATLAGWEGKLEFFRVQEGAVVGGAMDKPTPRNEFLTTTREFGDFELTLKARLLGTATNAGIQIRSRRVPNHNEVCGYQVDMSQGAPNYWGCLYDESRRNKVLAGPTPEEQQKIVKPDDWNEYVIRCQGPRIELWLNGTKTVDYTEADPKIEQTGIIGLQIHGGPPGEAWYKDIELTPLPPAAK